MMRKLPCQNQTPLKRQNLKVALAVAAAAFLSAGARTLQLLLFLLALQPALKMLHRLQ